MASAHGAQKATHDQSFIGLWCHDPNFPAPNIIETMMRRLNSTFDYVREFDDVGSFTSYLVKGELIANVVVIISSVLRGSHLNDLVVQQAKDEPNKFRGPYLLLFKEVTIDFKQQMLIEIDNLFLKIRSDIGHNPQYLPSTELDIAITSLPDSYTHNELVPPVGVFNSPFKQTSIRHLSNESLRFIQFQALIEILLRIQHDEKRAKDEMLSDCRMYYQNDITELLKINIFKEKYCAADAIDYHKKDCFCFRMVNMAFRSEDIERIYTYRLFITDLHKELYRRAVINREFEENLILYRGKKLPYGMVQQLKDNVHRLVSMNGFLSTTKNEEVAKAFSGDDVPRDSHASVIFELHIQKPVNYTGKPFLDISKDGGIMNSEEEILFSVGSVWRIESVQRVQHLWYAKLTNCADLDAPLNGLLTHLTNGYTLMSIGNLLRELGENDKAENFYRRMLDDESNITNEQKGLLHYHIGILRVAKKDYHGALDSLKRAVPYFSPPTRVTERDSSSASLITNASVANQMTIFLDIGKIHYRNKNWKEAQEAWQNALTSGGLPEDLAKVYDYLGSLAREHGEYKQAVEHHQRAMDWIAQCSGREKAKHEYKRKFDEVEELSNKIDERLKPKRQRTTSGSESDK